MGSESELVVGHVDHTLQPGQRVQAEPSDFEKMRQELGENEQCQFDRCVMCSQELSQGEFGLDHVMYYRVGDESRKCAKVRTLPRIWCTPCAIDHAKRMGKPRAKSRDVKNFLEMFATVGKELADDAERANDKAGYDPIATMLTNTTFNTADSAPPPAEETCLSASNPVTQRAWQLAASAVGQLEVSAGKVKIALDPKPRGVKMQGTIDPHNPDMSCSELKTLLQWTGTTKVDNEELRSTGRSTILINGAGELISETCHSCEPILQPNAAAEESDFARCELVKKVWKKKGVPEVIKLLGKAQFASLVSIDAAKANAELLQMF